MAERDREREHALGMTFTLSDQGSSLKLSFNLNHFLIPNTQWGGGYGIHIEFEGDAIQSTAMTKCLFFW